MQIEKDLNKVLPATTQRVNVHVNQRSVSEFCNSL